MPDLLVLGVIHACEWPLKNPTNVFEGVFNANVFYSVQVVHIESKMVIFYESTAARFQTFFQLNFAYDYAFVWKMAVLL